jgi:hypothetical protein
MTDSFKVTVSYGYQTVSEIEDDDLGIEVLMLIKAKRGVKAPRTAEAVLIEQQEKAIQKAETDAFTLREELRKMSKAFEALKPSAVSA